MDNDQALATLFHASGKSLALAESCTGGMVAARITALAGCSAWFRGGVVAYHNDVKQRLLGVPLSLLEQYGAVSEQVALEMAKGVRRLLGSDLALAVTGIAGPDGGTLEKPVGTVYLALASSNGCEAVRCQFRGDRAAVRSQSVQQAFFLLKMQLQEPEMA